MSHVTHVIAWLTFAVTPASFDSDLVKASSWRERHGITKEGIGMRRERGKLERFGLGVWSQGTYECVYIYIYISIYVYILYIYPHICVCERE